MKTLGLTIAVVMIATLAVTAGPISAATSSGPYYPTPSWDQQLACASAANCPRFIVLSNWIDLAHPSGGAAVLDRETGLVWEQSPETTSYEWDTGNATSACANRNVGGRKGWRLPSIVELASLIDPTVAAPGPTLPAGHPFTNVQHNGGDYWSATTQTFFPTAAWTASFFDGVVHGFIKTGMWPVWCVRGGMNADQY